MDYIREPKAQQNKRRLNLRSTALSLCGQHRKVNQDAVFHWSDQTGMGQNIGVYVVCDGLGGHLAGEVASHLAVETVITELTPVFSLANAFSAVATPRPSSAKLGQWIKGAITKANSGICRYAHSHANASNMGTTITLAVVYDRMVQIANVGDCRAYHWRAPHLTQITHDHSLVASLAEKGVIEETEQAMHPQSNLVLRSLGRENTVDVDLFSRQLEPADKLLLCSDGLWKAFPDAAELGRWFRSPTSPTELCRQLITEAYLRDGADDSSAVVVAVG
jgi:protein phosphatase